MKANVYRVPRALGLGARAQFCCLVLIVGSGVTGACSQTRKPVHHAAAPSTPAVTAPTGPSMEEAVAFFRDTIAPDCTYRFKRCTNFSLTLADETSIRYRQEGKSSDGVQGFTESRIDLKQLDPTLVTKTDQYITVVSKGESKAIVFQDGNSVAKAYPKQDFIVDSVQDLENSRKTIIYMIQLAQGTPTQQATQDLQEAKRSAGESSGNSPRLFDTIDYIHSLSESHGCAVHRWHDHYVNTSGTHDYNSQNRGCTRAIIAFYGCGMRFHVEHTGFFYDEEQRDTKDFGVDFSKLDPSSVRQSEADLAHERDDGDGRLQELGIGRMVNVQQLDGHSRGPFYMDTPENADHLINALTHAIQLCGGKKSAF